MGQITPYITLSTRLELAAVVVDNVTCARDCIAWGGSADGKFTVKAAYALLTERQDSRPNMSSFFARIWGVIAPERVRVFLWMVGIK